MRAFFKDEAPKIAKQVVAAKTRIGKAELSRDELDAVELIVAELDFHGWSILTGEVDDWLEEIVKDGGYAALAQVGIDVKAEEGAAGVVNRYAVDYAKERGAEMVGMRYNELGDLVENPRAEWAITESTRDMLRGLIADAMESGASNQTLANSIEDSYAFSKDRAMVIARTETQMASNGGALTGYKASGVVASKQWVTAEDDQVEEECIANSEAGPGKDGVLGLDEDYPSGDDAPPAHPNCRCVIVPVIETEGA